MHYVNPRAFGITLLALLKVCFILYSKNLIVKSKIKIYLNVNVGFILFGPTYETSNV